MKEIKIIGAPTTPGIKLEEIKNKIDATYVSGGMIDGVYQELSTLLMTKNEMDYAKKDFMSKVNEALENFNKGYDEIGNIIATAKKIALETAEATKTNKRKITKDGEVKMTTETHLPKGIKYIASKKSWDYDETRIPDKFFKKTLKKTEAKKAVEAGELPYDIVTLKLSKPSISFETALIRDGAAKLLEAGLDESV